MDPAVILHRQHRGIEFLHFQMEQPLPHHIIELVSGAEDR